MPRVLVNALERLGVIPSVAKEAEHARAWLAARENGPRPGPLRGRPHRGTSDSQLSRLTPAVRALFGFVKGGVRIIPTARHDPTCDDGETVWPEGEAIAAPELLYLLRRSYPDREVQITPSSDLDAMGKWKKCNLVVLGGPHPGSNEVAAEAWPQLDVPYKFAGHALLTTDGDVVCEAFRDADRIHDCALLVRGTSPFARDRSIVLMAGVLTQGTCAAGVYAKHQGWLREVVPAIRGKSELAAIWWKVIAGVNDPWPLAGELCGPVVRR